MRKRAPRVSVLLTVAVVSGGVFMGSATPLGAQTASFTVDLGVYSSGSETGKRFDVVSGEGPWIFQVTRVTGVNALVLSIRDSSPGDFCHYSNVKKPKAGGVPITTGTIPAATEDACGEQYPDVNGAPLVFYATFQGGKSAGVSVTVTYPTAPPTP